MLQIPAFPCRQTDLLVAAARTGKTVNIKKGHLRRQPPWPMPSPKSENPATTKCGSRSVAPSKWLRGPCGGHAWPGGDALAPTIMDLTHSLQQPNQVMGVTGGRPELIATMARAAVAAGADGVSIETHPIRPSSPTTGPTCCPSTSLKACSPPWPASTSGAKPTLLMTFSFRTILTTSAFL